MISKLLRLALGLGLLVAIAAGAAGWWAWQQLQQPFGDFTAGPRSIDVEPGTSATAILRQLEATGVLPDAQLARLYLIYGLRDPALKAGEYRFEKPASTPQVLDMLIRGTVVTYPLTVIEGLSLGETATAIADAGFGELAELQRQMARAELIRDLDSEASNLEGYLYPDTYQFARGATEAEIVATMVRTFKSRWQRVVPALAERPDLGVRDLVTLASIIEKETQKSDERGLVSSVYNNRLRIGMGLYADPTVIYGLKLLGTWDGNLRRRDLKFDTPYNTYMHRGLPPGPICSPTVASLLAAARPDDTEFLYFVSRNDGTHVFAQSKAEHDRNVNVWQKQYWRRKWAQERQSGQ